MKLPNQLCEYLERNGSHELLKGYLKLLELSDIAKYSSLLEKVSFWEGGIPFAVTAFGDVLVWNDNFVYKYDLIDADVKIILSGFDFFFQNIEDKEYQKDNFDLDLYNNCCAKLGKLEKDECFTYSPLPLLGGSKKIETIGKGGILEYLNIIINVL